MSVHNPDKGLVYRRSQNSKKKKIKEERNLIKGTHFWIGMSQNRKSNIQKAYNKVSNIIS